MKLRKATRQKAKIRLGLSAVSGGGKTYSALLIGYGLCGDWGKIAVIDTENNSADLYAHLGDFNVLPLSAPYAPETYIEAIHECEGAGMEVIIIDSITHEWDGKGGCLEIVDKLGGKYQDWGKVTPRHQAFIDSMLQSPCHIITTVRRKQDYEMTKDNNGRVKVEKAGLKEVTRDGWEYELTINLQLDHGHLATASKDRTELFMGKPEFTPTVETGKMIAKWCECGLTAEDLTKQELPKLIESCNSVKDVVALYNQHKSLIDNSPELKDLVAKRRDELKPKKEPEAKQEPAKEPEPAKQEPQTAQPAAEQTAAQQPVESKPVEDENMQQWKEVINSCNTIAEIKALYKDNKEVVDNDPAINALFAGRKKQITKPQTA